MIKLFLAISILFLNFLYVEFALAAVKEVDIIYFCQNKYGNPWSENASHDCLNSFMGAVLGTLLSVNEIGEIKTEMLDFYEWDYNNKYYIFKLKENLYFQNGRKVTVEDLEFSILRPYFAKKANKGSMIFFNLKGIQKIHHGQTYKSGLVEGVKILDSRTVAVIPMKFSPLFLYHFTRIHFSLVPREELNNDLSSWKKWPIGAGAYKINSEDKKNKGFTLSLVNEKNYPNAPRSIFFEQERIFEPDVSIRDSISLFKKSEYKSEQLFHGTYRRIIDFNFKSKLGRNLEFRKAVSMALSRNEISSETDFLTKPLYEIIESGSIGRINIKENRNRNEASQIFKKLLGSSHKEKFKIPYSPDNLYFGSKYKKIMKSQFEKAGLHVEFYEMNGNLYEFFSQQFKDSPFRLFTMSSDSFNSLIIFSLYSRKSCLINQPFIKDRVFENLIEEAKYATTKEVLNEKLKNLSWYFNANKIIIPLFEGKMIVHFNPQKIFSIGTQFGSSIFYLHNLEMKRDRLINKKKYQYLNEVIFRLNDYKVQNLLLKLNF